MSARAVRALFVAAVAASLPACGGDGNLPCYPVSGKVTLDGKPLAGVTVVLHPVDKARFKRDERPFARTEADGSFKLTTYEKQDGAPDGEYKVAIAFEAGGPAGDDDGSDQAVRGKKGGRPPERYGSPDKSGLTATIPKSSTTLPPFELTGK
jgi:hypothetical protein